MKQVQYQAYGKNIVLKVESITSEDSKIVVPEGISTSMNVGTVVSIGMDVADISVGTRYVVFDPIRLDEQYFAVTAERIIAKII